MLAMKVQEHESNHTHILKTIKITTKEMHSLHLETSELSFHVLESKNLKDAGVQKSTSLVVWAGGHPKLGLAAW